MKRTTISAEEALLDRLRAIARRDQISLAEVMRQGLEWRAGQSRRFSLVGAVKTGQPSAIADEADDLHPEPQPWR